jgi:uncharacterized protein (TIGR03663 family)
MSYREAAGWKVWKTMQQNQNDNIENSPVTIENSPVDVVNSSIDFESSPVDIKNSPGSIESSAFNIVNSSVNSENKPEISEKNYKILGLLIILFALLIRLYNLGERVFHHDESVHASFTLKILNTGQYTYDPSYHGPFLFHSTAIVFHYLGINDTTARLIPVFFGVATIPLLFLLEKEIGKRGVLWSAFLLAFSPSMVYYSRFFRNDSIIVFCTLATVAGGIRYLENLHSIKRYPYLLLVASSLAIAVSSKENAYLVILMFGAFGGLYLLYRLYSEWKTENLSLKKTLLLKSSAYLPFLPELVLSAALFFLIAMMFYTSYFRYYTTPFEVVEKAFSHWMEMHRIQRLGGPFYYYVPILLLYEIPILFFGIVGIIHFLRKKNKNTAFFLFLSYWAVASLLLYSYLQEKVPWLVVHIVLPFGILAGAYLGEFFSRVPDNRQTDNKQTEQVSEAENGSSGSGKKPAFKVDSSRVRTLIAGILALTLMISLFQCVSVNFYKSMDPNERMVYTQSSPDIRELMEKIEGFNKNPDTLTLCVLDPNDLYWPLPWYLRDYKLASYFRKPPSNLKYDAIIAPVEYKMYREISENEYASYNFTLRPGRDFILYYKKGLE